MTIDQIESLQIERDALVQECEKLKQERHADRLLIENALALKNASSKLNADLESLRTEVAQLKQRRFPIMGGLSVPWSLVVPYEGQAFANHDQSLERLAQRGGLDTGELWCIVHGKRWREAPSKAVAEAWLRGWLHEHESAAAERDALQRKLEAERELAVQLVKNESALRKQAEAERDEALTSLRAPEVHWDCQQKIDSLEAERDQVHARLAEACMIADEWIDLGIPDDDAIEAKGAIADIRKAASIIVFDERNAARGETAYAKRLSPEELATELAKENSPEDREYRRVEIATSPLFDIWLRFLDVCGDRAIDRLDITDEDAEAAAKQMEDHAPAGTAFAYVLRQIPHRRRLREISHKTADERSRKS